MRIAVVGAGGIGAPFGVSLAKAGADVIFVARGAHLAAMRDNGLRVEGDRGETHLRPTQATDDPAEIGPVDIVLLCVKLWDVETAGAHIRPLVGPDTAVIPLQNGVDAHDRLIPILGHRGGDGRHRLCHRVDRRAGGGAPDRYLSDDDLRRTRRPAQRARSGACRNCARRPGSKACSARTSWCRFGENSWCWSRSPTSTRLTRVPLGKYRDDPDLWELVEASLRETEAVGRAEGVDLPADAFDKSLAMFRSMPPHHMTSMGNDLLRGNRLELLWFAGKVVELGRKHGIPTPVNSLRLRGTETV